MIVKKSTRPLTQWLVACNIYVSSGRHPILLRVLEDAQKECTRLRQVACKGYLGEDPGKRTYASSALSIVHAYADKPYDRSSFHLVGSSHLVASLASHIATNAIEKLHTTRKSDESSGNQLNNDFRTTHPTVGIVDHISILPLYENYPVMTKEEWIGQDFHDPLDGSLDVELDISNDPTLPTGWVARMVGIALKKIGVEVFFYGHADPKKMSLADVRKLKTKFFATPLASDQNQTSSLGQATIGAPFHFVENYNIQVETLDKQLARSLTKWVRSRDGGLDFVEALTLPYGTNPCGVQIYEVACNLLNPAVTSSQDIDQRVQKWPYLNHVAFGSSYRVGTTVEMCHEAIVETSTAEREKAFNARIREKLASFLY